MFLLLPFLFLSLDFDPSLTIYDSFSVSSFVLQPYLRLCDILS